jgi:hypothetical protein
VVKDATTDVPEVGMMKVVHVVESWGSALTPQLPRFGSYYRGGASTSFMSMGGLLLHEALENGALITMLYMLRISHHLLVL